MLKKLIARIRPYDAIESIKILVPPETSFSFPSGHTMVMFAFAAAMTMAFGKKGAWAFSPAVLMGFSRIYVGVHYPTDVLAGMIVGCLVSFITFKLFHLVWKPKEIIS